MRSALGVQAGRAASPGTLLGWLFALAVLAMACILLRPDGPAPDGASGVRGGTHGSVPAKLPTRFEPNRGQTDPRVRFLARGPGYRLFLTRREAVLSLSGPEATVRLRPLGANPRARLSAAERQVGTTNYLRGSARSRSITGVRGYGQVRYHDLYPGVDLVYHGRRGMLEYDFALAPGAEPGDIALALEGVERLSVDRRGDLLMRASGTTIRQRRPHAYQRIGGVARRVPARFRVERGNRVKFAVGRYDRSRPLVIDPVISYSSYLGGTSLDEGEEIAVPAGCPARCETYVTGTTDSPDFPTVDAPQSTSARLREVFVSKLTADGSALAYSTYLGGGDNDEGRGIAVDGSGSAYLTGQTGSGGDDFPCNSPGCPNDFPTVGSMQGYGGNDYDAFVAKLTPDGSALAYSTYLGGIGNEGGSGIALEPGCASNCEAYLTGYTTSPDFPVVGPFQPALGGTPGTPALPGTPVGDGVSDAFVTKINASGSALSYSSFLGGLDIDSGSGIAVDSSGAAYVAGATASLDFPTSAPLQGSLAGGVTDGFVTKVGPAGDRLGYSTYLGGTSTDVARGIYVDGARSAHATGTTESADFPTARPLQGSLGGATDAFVTKLGETGAELAFSTYLGGTGSESAHGIAGDARGDVLVTGETASGDYLTLNAMQGSHGGGARDAFIAKLSPFGSVSFSSYLGGSGGDAGRGIAVDGSGTAYLVGVTQSSDFPMEAPLQNASSGLPDAFVAMIKPLGDVSVAMSAAPHRVFVGEEVTYTVSVRNAGSEVVTAALRDELPPAAEFVRASSGCLHGGGLVTCELGPLAAGGPPQIRYITVRAGAPSATLRNSVSVSSTGVDPDASNDTASAVTAVARRPSVRDEVPGVAPAPGRAAAGSPSAARSQGGDRRRARAMRRCLARARRIHRRKRSRRSARRRCLRRYGRTPGRITRLRAVARSGTEIELSFRAPAGAGRIGPPARRYLIAQSTRRIGGRRGLRGARRLCKGACRVQVAEAGDPVRLRITDLRPRTTYYYVVAARDNVSGRLGPRSRAVRARTR